MKIPYVISVVNLFIAWAFFMFIENKTPEQTALALMNCGLLWLVIGLQTKEESK